ncbi:hypothetical protein [Falsiroseomonas sp.]|uniref:hypothetical protein n=1 Tax=Falsiroseomonas sp. TaxID=2870721 RepID=UPI003F6EF1BB
MAEEAKTAVVMIHGIGEQRPMETLWGFVTTAWSTDRDLTGDGQGETFAKPDQMSGSFELRRVTTRKWTGEAARRVDFFEFYWAHLLTGNTVADVLGWLKRLLWRWPSSVPPRLKGMWRAGLVAGLLAIAIALLAWLKPGWRPATIPYWVWPLATALAGLGWFLLSRFGGPVLGDAARYLSPTPNNVAARQRIREAGIDLLEKLRASGKYDRIIVVGHSLGSVIGYDVLNHAFARIGDGAMAEAHDAAVTAAMQAVEAAAVALRRADEADCGAARVAYREAQRAYAAALAQAPGRPWLVSDFVTCGSPLSKADVLLAQDAAALKLAKLRRQAPTAPPWLEEEIRFTYRLKTGQRIPHHAAVFAPVVWTNIYHPSRLVAFGDFISGPVAPILGRGILDIQVPIGAWRFLHTRYWRLDAGKQVAPVVRALRRALNLRGASEEALWGDQATAPEVAADKLP